MVGWSLSYKQKMHAQFQLHEHPDKLLDEDIIEVDWKIGSPFRLFVLFNHRWFPTLVPSDCQHCLIHSEEDELEDISEWPEKHYGLCVDAVEVLDEAFSITDWGVERSYCVGGWVLVQIWLNPERPIRNSLVDESETPDQQTQIYEQTRIYDFIPDEEVDSSIYQRYDLFHN